MSDERERGGEEPHVVGHVVCRICRHEWVAVAPASRGLEDLECPNCRNMTGESDDDDPTAVC